MDALSRLPSSRSILNSGSSSKNSSKTKLALEFLRHDKVRYSSEGQPVPIPLARIEQQRKRMVNKRFSAIMKAKEGSNNNNLALDNFGVVNGKTEPRTSLNKKKTLLLDNNLEVRRPTIVEPLPGFRYHRNGEQRSTRDHDLRKLLRSRYGLSLSQISRLTRRSDDQHSDGDSRKSEFEESSVDGSGRESFPFSFRMFGESKRSDNSFKSDIWRRSNWTSRGGSKDSSSKRSNQTSGSGSLRSSNKEKETNSYKRGLNCFKRVQQLWDRQGSIESISTTSSRATKVSKSSNRSSMGSRGSSYTTMSSGMPGFLADKFSPSAICRLHRLIEKDVDNYSETRKVLRRERDNQLTWHKNQEQLRAVENVKSVNSYLEQVKRWSRKNNQPFLEPIEQMKGKEEKAFVTPRVTIKERLETPL